MAHLKAAQRQARSGHDLALSLREEADRLGFAACGIVEPRAIAAAMPRLKVFLARGYHGSMDWLARAPERRARPEILWPAVKSVVVLGVNYAPEKDPMRELDERQQGFVSVYARGADYHDVVKTKLKALARWLVSEAGGEVKIFVDTAAVMEKPLAEAAGLGWQGKHTNLVSRDFGSWLFLGALFTTLTLPADVPLSDHCGACRRCMDVCPTDAFPAPYVLDARRCISYLTIEHKGHIPREFRAAMGNRIYGCDDCLAVCPWNKFARRTREMAFLPRDALTAPRLCELAALDDEGFRKRFSGSAIKRIGRDRFVRNVLIAIGNSKTPELAASAERLLSDASPLVRAAAVWALARLAPARARTLVARYRGAEIDSDVSAEWNAAERAA
jgi:epoxyqueuosine reductase